MTIASVLERAAASFPERAGLTVRGRRLTYPEMLEAARRAAGWLGARLASPSPPARLGLLDVNSGALPLCLFGAAFARLPFVPLNYRLTGGELDALIDRVLPAILVVGPDYLAGVRPRAGLALIGREAFLDLALAGPVPAIAAAADEDAVAVQLFTSGTTGRPKAALLRHRHLIAYLEDTQKFGSAAATDAQLIAAPPYHIAGNANALTAVYVGRRMVHLANFDPAGWLATARAEAATSAFVVPTMLGRILEQLARTGETAPPSLRAISYGGGRMPVALLQRALAQFPNAGFLNAYGMTETASTICTLTPDDHRAAAASPDPAIRRRLGSAGRPTPRIEMEIRDEQGHALGPGQSGRVFVRGIQVAGEYQDLGRLVDGDGWFDTRDRGQRDAAGYLFVEGRLDDVIVRGGENISPGEIEEVLNAHPAVAECAAVAMLDEEWGEAVAAFVVRQPGVPVEAGELQDHVRRHLRSSRVPARVIFRDALPYNETGKLLRRVLRQELEAHGPG